MRFTGIVYGCVVIGAIAGSAAQAQTPEHDEAKVGSSTIAPDIGAPTNRGSTEVLEQLPWLREGLGSIGDRAALKIPEGYHFGDAQTTNSFLRATGNIPGGNELAIVGPLDGDWFVIYEFEDIGYVKDDEELDPDDMLVKQREGIKVANEYREQHNLPAVTLLGWAIPPRYQAESNVLEWAVDLEFTLPDQTKERSINYRTKILGRRGVMDITLVCDPGALDRVLLEYREMMKGFSFVEGERYAEYKPGDKVAQYGLAALVLGGATAVAAKTGMFAAILLFFKKGLKFVVLGIAALGAGLSRLFGGRKNGPKA